MSEDAKSPREAWLESYEASRAALLDIIRAGGEPARYAVSELMRLETERMALV